MAAALATHEGPLVLSGLGALSDEAANSLATHRGIVNFQGLEILSPTAAAALRANAEIEFPQR